MTSGPGVSVRVLATYPPKMLNHPGPPLESFRSRARHSLWTIVVVLKFGNTTCLKYNDIDIKIFFKKKVSGSFLCQL